jgi:hypothetical protein
VWLAWLFPWLSQLHCARGELDLAGQWLAVARKALPASRHGVLASPEALLALRQGRYEEAIVGIEACLSADDTSDTTRSHFSFLRAFAYERAGRPLPVEEVRAIVAARVSSEGRALPVEKWWVELAAFVEKHAPGDSA